MHECPSRENSNTVFLVDVAHARSTCLYTHRLQDVNENHAPIKTCTYQGAVCHERRLCTSSLGESSAW